MPVRKMEPSSAPTAGIPLRDGQQAGTIDTTPAATARLTPVRTPSPLSGRHRLGDTACQDASTPDAPEVAYAANGNVNYRGGHLDAERHGPREFFRRDGSMLRTGAFDRGTQVGVWRWYDRESIVTRETDFGGSEP